jgi:hypothetical protein
MAMRLARVPGGSFVTFRVVFDYFWLNLALNQTSVGDDGEVPRKSSFFSAGTRSRSVWKVVWRRAHVFGCGGHAANDFEPGTVNVLL